MFRWEGRRACILLFYILAKQHRLPSFAAIILVWMNFFRPQAREEKHEEMEECCPTAARKTPAIFSETATAHNNMPLLWLRPSKSNPEAPIELISTGIFKRVCWRRWYQRQFRCKYVAYSSGVPINDRGHFPAHCRSTSLKCKIPCLGICTTAPQQTLPGNK